MRRIVSIVLLLFAGFALLSLPLSLWEAGRLRAEQQTENEAQDHRLCVYTQRQWDTLFNIAQHFDNPRSPVRQIITGELGPRPHCVKG